MNTKLTALGTVIVALGIAGVAVLVTRSAARKPPPVAAYDLSAFMDVDPAKVLYDEAPPYAVAISNAHALALDGQGRILVAGDGALAVLNADGTPVDRWALSGAARCLTVSPEGRVLAGFERHVEALDATGKNTGVWSNLNDRALLTSLAVIGNRVFAADYGNRIVWVFDAEGNLLGRVGDKDTGKRKSGFVIPSPYFDVAAAADGTLWAANTGCHRLEHFTADGKLISFWGEAGMAIERFSGCCNPSHFAIAPDGTVVTAEKGLPRVKVYAADGTLLGVVAGPRAFDEGTVGLDVAVDAAGRVLVLDAGRGQVRVFVRRKGL